MESIEGGCYFQTREACKLFKRRQLIFEFRDRLTQHLLMARVLGNLKLLYQSLAGEHQPVAFAVALPLLG